MYYTRMSKQQLIKELKEMHQHIAAFNRLKSKYNKEQKAAANPKQINKELPKKTANDSSNIQKIQRQLELERDQRIRLEKERGERLQFINTLAHELKTPLTSIVASGGLLLEELKEDVESPRVRLLANIIRGTERLTDRLTEFLDMAKMESVGFKPSYELLDIRAIIQNVSDEIIPITSQKNQSLTLSIPTSVPLINGDKQYLAQVLLNILTNASKFTGEGSKIQLKLRIKGANLVLQIKDNGPGITEEEQTRIFTPYYRIEADRQRFPGLGLGLTVCKHLVEMHGGKMEVKSKLGIGSTFTISLPFAEQSLE